MRTLAIQEQCDDADGGRGLEVIEPVIDQHAIRGFRSDELRDVGPIRGLALVRMLGVPAEDSVDQARQAGSP